jgi:phage major head subunit gpT-like protein
MVINGSSLTATFVEYRAAFQGAFDAADAEFEMITGQETLGKQRSVKMYWGGQVPTMRKYVGDAQFDQIDVFNWEIGIDKYQAGLEIKREDFDDDNLGWVRPYVAGLGVEARQHPGRELVKLLEAGDTTLCYDGQFFFDTDHKDGDGPVQSNKITGAPSETKLQEMRQTMARLKDMKGRPMPRRLTHIVCPPEQEQTWKKILAAEYGANGSTNVEKGAAKLVVLNHLTSALKWYGFDLSTPFRPLMLFWRDRPEFTAQDSLTDEQAFLREVFRYKVRSRFGFGYGLWQFACMSTGS